MVKKGRSMEYREKIDAFRESCRVYLKEKQAASALTEDSEEMFIRFLSEDIQFVENTFEKIRQECGIDAENVIRRLFVDDMTQSEVAYEFGISRRQLQYSLYIWFQRVFANM